MEYIWKKPLDILGKNYGIHRAKIMGTTMGYICQKQWDIYDKN